STAAALAATDLLIRRPSGPLSVPGLAVAGAPTDLPADLGRPSLAILCVKGYDTAGAIETLRSVRPDVVLTLQNGIGNEARLAEAFGANHVIAGAITTSVDLIGPTEIAVTKEGGVVLAPLDPAIDLAPWQG